MPRNLRLIHRFTFVTDFMFIIFEGLQALIGHTPDDVLSTVKNVRLLTVRNLRYLDVKLIGKGMFIT